MELSPTSKKYIEKYMLDYIYDKNVSWVKRDNNTTHVYKSLYKDIQKAFLHVLNLEDTDCMKGVLHKNKEIKSPTQFSDHFMTAEIKKYIEMYGKTQITFTCSILGKSVSISFMIFSNNDHLDTYQKYAEYMYAWLYICIKYSSKKCANTMHIYVYHTPYYKQIPKNKTEIIGPEHVNTAYTTPCVKDGEIVIYRKEEWFKVFIHETLHVYGLDFSSYPTLGLVNVVKKIFPVKSEFILEEAYSETWARIINCAFTSFLSLKEDENITKYLMYMDILVQIEKFFSLKQMIYVLNYMGLTYKDMYSMDEKSVLLRNSMYRENTNVFSYYILTSMFMCDFQGFLSLCKYNNCSSGQSSDFIRFKYSEENMDDFGNYIISLYKSNDFLNAIETIEKYKREKRDDTMRMSIIEFK